MAMFATGILLNISRGAPDMWETRRKEREQERDARRWDKRRDKILRRREDLRDRFDD
jgi:hypothetical protein